MITGETLVVMRHLMSLLTAFMPLMIYNTANNFFDDRRKAIICALLYAFSAIFWYDSLYISGLYANLLTNLIAVSSLSIIYESVNEKNPGYYLAILLSGTSLVLSHSTSIIFIVTAWIFMILIKVRKQGFLNKYSRSVTFLSVPLIGVFFYPKILSRLSNILSGQFVAIELGDPVFNLIRPLSPFIAYMSGYMGIVVVSIILTGFFYLIVDYKNKDFWSSFFSIWFLFIWILSLQGRQVWRFALLAKTPSIFLIGYLIGDVINSLEGIGRGYLRSLKTQTFNANGVSALLVVVVLISGGLLNYTFSSLSYRENAQRQKEIFQSFNWVSENTENNSKIMVLSEWEYIYLPQFTSREYYHVSITSNFNMTEIKEWSVTFSDYIILSSSLRESFKESGVFEETWSNGIVTIFLVSR
ncbi:hypothetical protein GF319_07775 [Candidatus Bathyarchaeota archaeon]|nr:hypothetical protein [Candidatus Bathyarchaeota archaeon]